MAGDSTGQQLPRDRLETGFIWQRASIEVIETLAPPCQADRTQIRITGRRGNVGECKVEAPQRREGRSKFLGKLFENDLAIVVESPVSDSRLPSPLRPPGSL